MNWNELLQLETYYQHQLATATKMHKKKEAIEQQIAHAQSEIAHYEQQLLDVRTQLDKLEQFSFINALREWTGKKDRLLEQKLEQAAVQELKLTEAQLMKEDLQDDLVDVLHKINAIHEAHLQEQLPQVKQQKLAWLEQHVPHVAKKLTQYLEEEQLYTQLIREIQEAIEAGRAANVALQQASQALADAKDLSTWDTFLGGGFIVTAMKHDKLEKSNSYVHNAQIAIQRFQNELLDVQNMKTETLNIDIDGFVKFADFFFDDIFSEWSVHSKIKDAQMQLTRVIDDIDNTLAELEQKLAYGEHQYEKVKEDKRNLLSKDEQSLFLL